MQKGWFVTFEGLDKAGKTTQINLFCDFLHEKSISFLFTREPGGNPVSEKIRSLLLDPQNSINPMCEAMLYAAARSELVHSVLQPAIDSGCNVVCDRYVDSSVAYQGFGRELGMDAVMDINAHATGGLMPNLTFFLSLSPEDAQRRARGEKDRIESAESAFHERVYRGYQTICAMEPERFCVIDANRPIDVVQKEIQAAFCERFML